MSRGARQTPGRDQAARIWSFEVEIETVWSRLRWKPMTVSLSPSTGLLTTHWPQDGERPGEVGTYTKDVTLADFRADCFDALDKTAWRRR